MFWALFWRGVIFGMLVFNIKVHFMNSWKIMWNVLLHIISSWLSPLHWTQFQVLYKKYFGRQVSNHVSLGSKIFGQISMVSLSQPGVPTSRHSILVSLVWCPDLPLLFLDLQEPRFPLAPLRSRLPIKKEGNRKLGTGFQPFFCISSWERRNVYYIFWVLQIG